MKQEILVDVHELSARLPVKRVDHLAASTADAEVRHLADLDDSLTGLPGLLPLLQQMVALHYQRINIIQAGQDWHPQQQATTIADGIIGVGFDK